MYVYHTVFPIVLRYVARYDVRNTLFAYNLYAIASIRALLHPTFSIESMQIRTTQRLSERQLFFIWLFFVFVPFHCLSYVGDIFFGSIVLNFRYARVCRSIIKSEMARSSQHIEYSWFRIMRLRRDSYHSIQRDLRVIYFYRFWKVDAAVCATSVCLYQIIFKRPRMASWLWEVDIRTISLTHCSWPSSQQ